jgi:hypothetical protein
MGQQLHSVMLNKAMGSLSIGKIKIVLKWSFRNNRNELSISFTKLIRISISAVIL